MLVAGIETVWGGAEQPGAGNVRVQHYDSTTYDFSKGGELGRFKFGSTAIMLFQADRCSWLETAKAGDEVRVGERIATLSTVVTANA